MVWKTITQKQKELIDCMNEFCSEKFLYNDRTPCLEASNYISRNIEEYKWLSMSEWQTRYM